jgi:hypothetical protein
LIDGDPSFCGRVRPDTGIAEEIKQPRLEQVLMLPFFHSNAPPAILFAGLGSEREPSAAEIDE